MTYRNSFIIIGLFITALIIRIGVYKYYESPPSTTDVSAEAQVSAIAIMDSYESDESAANHHYLNKYVDITGVVSKMVTNEKCSVYLITNSLLGYVIAELSNCDDIEGLSKGSSITVRGLCSGYLSDVILVRSIIVTD